MSASRFDPRPESVPTKQRRGGFRARVTGLVLLLAFASAAPAEVHGVTIERRFVPVGEMVPGLTLTSRAAPDSTAGGGDFRAIVNAACDIWEQALHDEYTLTLHFAWAATTSGRAEHYGLEFAGEPPREVTGTILFDATPGGTYRFYLDPTPHTSEEYRLFDESGRDYGGGTIVNARRFHAPTGPAADPGVHDLLTIALHEIGHALGMSFMHPRFAAISPAGGVVITAPRPNPGTILSFAADDDGFVTSHLEGPEREHFVMGLGEGTPTTRFLPTAADILAAAELNSIAAVELDPHPVRWTYAPGLVADYFLRQPGSDVFTGFVEDMPVASGVVDCIRFPVGSIPWPGLDARFARDWGARLTGALVIEQPGEYAFHLAPGGQVQITLARAAMVRADGTVGPELPLVGWALGPTPAGTGESVVRVWLEAGYHDFAFEYAHRDGPGGCVLRWSQPGRAPEIIPPSAFVRPVWAEITGPPAIFAQPQPVTIFPGHAANLRVGALGLPDIVYQWRKDGVAIPGENSGTLNFSPATPELSGIYDCVLATENGAVISAAVPVAVLGERPGRPINVSIRGRAGADENTLIAGFTIGGPAGSEKTVLIRVAGPALADLEVTGFVADPAVQVFDGTGALIAANDDWDATLVPVFTRVGAFPWREGSRDAALRLVLPPGEYTAHVLNPGPVAEALLEVYDESQDAATSLVNASCRLLLAPDETAIAGVVLDAPGRLLVRHAGPALGRFGVVQPAQDTALQVFRGGREIARNEHWDATLAPEFARVQAFPWTPGSDDAATMLAGPAGGYTLHCRAQGAGGVSLVEFYVAPPATEP